MSAQPRKPDKRPSPAEPSRLSRRTIRLWTRALVSTLGIGAAIGIALTIAGAVRHDDDLLYGGVGVVLLFVVLTLIPAAWLGGQALAPLGGLFGLLLLVGIAGAAGGWSIGPLWGWAGVAVFFLAVAGFAWMRRRRPRRRPGR